MATRQRTAAQARRREGGKSLAAATLTRWIWRPGAGQGSETGAPDATCRQLASEVGPAVSCVSWSCRYCDRLYSESQEASAVLSTVSGTSGQTIGSGGSLLPITS